MALELLKVPDIKDRIHRCYMLFPTIEHMVTAPNGWWYTNVLQRYWTIIYIVAVLFSYLPFSIQAFLVYIYFYLFSVKGIFHGTTLKYLRPSILSKIVFLADEEMERIRDLDYDHVEKNKKILKIYYGATDGWTPIEYVRRLKQKIPDIDAEIDLCEYAHAFVLRSSVHVGKLTAGWILENPIN